MAQSLCKVYLHIIFRVRNTSPKILPEHLARLHRYIGGLANTTGCNVLKVGGIVDHVHVLLYFTRTETLAYVVEEMKRNSSRWIKTLSPHYKDFVWQSGYGAFSVSQSKVGVVRNYIKNQIAHHKKQGSKEEYLRFLKLYNIDYDERYVLSD